VVFFAPTGRSDVWLPAVAGGCAMIIDLPKDREVDGGYDLLAAQSGKIFTEKTVGILYRSLQQ
jgi:hypothetical protein